MQLNTNMADAPRDEILVLAIPSGDAEEPVELMTGSYDEEGGRWEGPWRYTDGLEDAEPVAWAWTPDVTPEVEEIARAAMADVEGQQALADAPPGAA